MSVDGRPLPVLNHRLQLINVSFFIFQTLLTNFLPKIFAFYRFSSLSLFVFPQNTKYPNLCSFLFTKIKWTKHLKPFHIKKKFQPAGEQPATEPRLEEFFHPSYVLDSDFKVGKTPSVPGRCETMSRYICTITGDLLYQVKKDCNWVNKHMVVPSPEESVTTYVEGFLSFTPTLSHWSPWTRLLWTSTRNTK